MSDTIQNLYTLLVLLEHYCETEGKENAELSFCADALAVMVQMCEDAVNE